MRASAPPGGEAPVSHIFVRDLHCQICLVLIYRLINQIAVYIYIFIYKYKVHRLKFPAQARAQGPLELYGTGPTLTLCEDQETALDYLYGALADPHHGLAILSRLPRLQLQGLWQLDLGRSNSTSLCLPEVLHSMATAGTRIRQSHSQTTSFMEEHSQTSDTSARSPGQQGTTPGQT